MEAKDFQALVDQLGGLTKEKREALIEAVEVRASANDASALIDCRFAAACCPHCKSVDCRDVVEAETADPLHVLRMQHDFTALTGRPSADDRPAILWPRDVCAWRSCQRWHG